ncbi:stage II sporulation protein D [Virgibacillus halotolerans]|uniref:stage II sporulation protein D n=1 Tax=Virgibacillus halotolerans TaxID=1071053 RepID=UPI0019620BB4|nr:stage II sporulation protein D [Virgibacillus halotolerans]MBM7601241.1 stage II sporulation protein D [Virgibacillus halotolerans]
MKNRNYSKWNSKARKKKRATLLKQIQLKQKVKVQKDNTTSNQTAPFKKITPIKRKKIYRNTPPPTWRIPTVLLLSSLILFILIIPTLIVVPFAKDNEKGSVPVEKQEEQTADDTAAEAGAEQNESTISVAVMRTKSETVEDIPLESYVAGVVSSEMSPDFEPEALKAQSLAARTYIVDHLLHQDDGQESDVTDTTQHQVFKNDNELKKQWGSKYDENMKKVKAAVTATKGEILTYKDAPIFPAFFSTSNGYTENSEDYWDDELPYLRSVESPWDEDSPKFLDQQTFTIDQIKEKLAVDLPNQEPLGIDVTRTDSQRVKEIDLAGNKLSGREVREKLELQSSDFTIKQKNDHLIFTTKGYGHGIGMSQYGANSMAKAGKTYQEIVKYYYSDVEVGTVTDTAPTLVAK